MIKTRKTWISPLEPDDLAERYIFATVSSNHQPQKITVYNCRSRGRSRKARRHGSGSFTPHRWKKEEMPPASLFHGRSETRKDRGSLETLEKKRVRGGEKKKLKQFPLSLFCFLFVSFLFSPGNTVLYCGAATVRVV